MKMTLKSALMSLLLMAVLAIAFAAVQPSTGVVLTEAEPVATDAVLADTTAVLATNHERMSASPGADYAIEQDHMISFNRDGASVNSLPSGGAAVFMTSGIAAA